ncbi:hypothetical protein H4Q26_011349 [Puccinia striiformis f. sp. tritici PST-130]|uniref:Core-binding (CB) domain-containing protein n=1 Tax=Puccinia striiformis f. sp. tritici PST-78 TaxID=1165861 RepID=A0A0L0W2G2_9BASI|nr:hypothetical protein H4Q26_011349 [Puccinia striiformis f. sp. tritici PST-130]KNF05694.1 hypothetical protein PSTG_01097 [Puccinia striiformis f. sp. tritici PST-78]
MVLQTHAILSGSKTIDFTKIKEFLQNGSVYSTPPTTNLHLLSAWSHSTLLGHNGTIKKYLNFSAEKHPGKLKLPISSSDVEAFCMWARRNEYVTHAKKINATSLRKYLIGLKAWHTFHTVQFPDSTKDQLNLLIKASAKADKLKMIVQKKTAVILWHLVFLFNTLSKGTNFDRALADLHHRRTRTRDQRFRARGPHGLVLRSGNRWDPATTYPRVLKKRAANPTRGLSVLEARARLAKGCGGPNVARVMHRHCLAANPGSSLPGTRYHRPKDSPQKCVDGHRRLQLSVGVHVDASKMTSMASDGAGRGVVGVKSAFSDLMAGISNPSRSVRPSSRAASQSDGQYIPAIKLGDEYRSPSQETSELDGWYVP